MCKKLIYFACLVLMFALVSTSYGQDANCCDEDCVVIGTWEDTSGDGWIDWGSGTSISDPPDPNDVAAYSFLHSVCATDGDYSLQVTQDGYGQSLAIKLNAAQREAFMDKSCFGIDFGVAAGTAGGWVEVYTVSLNADGYGWHDLGDKPAYHYDFWDGSPERCNTICWDYSEVFDTINDPPSYVEFILAINSGGDQDTMYFDNARLCVPEPTTIALLGLGGLVLIRRRK